MGTLFASVDVNTYVNNALPRILVIRIIKQLMENNNLSIKIKELPKRIVVCKKSSVKMIYVVYRGCHSMHMV